MEDMLFFSFYLFFLFYFFYFNPSASPVVFKPLLFSLGVILTFFTIVFSMTSLLNAIFLSVDWMFSKVLVAGAHIKEIVTIHLDVLDGDVVALTEWHVFAVA